MSKMGAATTVREANRCARQAGLSSSHDTSRGAFQKYVVVSQEAVAKLPAHIPFERGVVLPLGISTAAAGLFQKGYLGLKAPKIKPRPVDHERVLVIWGGSSSVGSCAIQLAKQSGLEIFTTASRSNFDYVKKLGAAKVFDYHDGDVEDQIVDALKNKTLAGVYHAVGADGAVQTCAQIADRSTGKAIVVTVKGVPDAGIPRTVRIKQISASAIFEIGNPIGPRIWDWLSFALSRGTLVPNPEPLIVGNGLRSIQLGLDKQKAGVSAQKVVVNKIDEDSSHELPALLSI